MIQKKQLCAVAYGLGCLAIILPGMPALAAGDAFNQGVRDAANAGTKGGLFMGSISDAITTAIKFLLTLVSLIAMVAIIYGGFMYITSIGNESKTETAKHIIIYAVIGLIVIGMGALITNVIISTFK